MAFCERLGTDGSLATGEKPMTQYRGRFAPTPSGPLHLGSLLTAVGSYLDAKAQGGQWLLRIDDLDPPRVASGAINAILHALEAFGLAWDEVVQYQSQRQEAYAEALEQLRSTGLLYACACTRREIADSHLGAMAPGIYPGTCRPGLAPGKSARAWRLDTRGTQVEIEDRLQGCIGQNLEHSSGDFVLHRADGLVAYQLAAVVDDAALGITDVVRGLDLLDSSLRQAYVYRLLGLALPRYLHLPVVVNAAGEKLSKQTLAPALDVAHPEAQLWQVLTLLQHAPPQTMQHAPVAELLQWAVACWDPLRLPRVRTLEQAS